MTTDENLRCVIIGEGTLPILCGEILRERGHEILALVSPDPLVSRWARSNAIAHATEPSALTTLLEARPFDYLLSIVNFQRLPDALLKAARRYAINYHDSPLPRYAGMHATSWALLHGETRYAVTWHVMTRQVDAGDILKQVPVDIDPDDTALSLNAKCYEAAVIGFRALLDDMEADAIDPRPQNPAERSFFRRSQRPPAGCTLPFDAPAEHLHALLRALDFGPYTNPLGLPKIALGESFAIVTELDVLDSRSGELPGTLVAITPETLVVTTASDDVALAGFFTIDGAPMAIAEVVERGAFRPGARVAAVENARAARLDALCAELSEHETFWLAQLTQARPTELPCMLRPAGPLQRIARHGLALDGDSQWFAMPASEHEGDRLLAAFMVYLARLTGAGSIDIGFSDPRLCAELGDLHPYFSTCVPLRTTGDLDGSFTQFAQAFDIQLGQLRTRRSYARDAPLRDPALRAQLDAADTSAWPIGVEMSESVDSAPTTPLPRGRVLTMRLGTDGKTCTLWYDPGVLDPALVEGISRQFVAFLRVLTNCTEQLIWTLPLL